jgi:hypothetical protein
MALAEDDDWAQGWSWDLPAKPLAEQLSRGAMRARNRRLHLWMAVLERWSAARADNHVRSNAAARR